MPDRRAGRVPHVPEREKGGGKQPRDRNLDGVGRHRPRPPAGDSRTEIDQQMKQEMPPNRCERRRPI